MNPSSSNYTRLIQRLFQTNLFGGMKLGLENCQRLQELLGFPDRAFASIHVAGTNGKGSVVSKIAVSLQEAGYRTGLYTSPHLSTFRERIRVNGTMISEERVEELLSFLFQEIEKHKIPATFFEITTFLAFLHFAAENVEFAVLETGLGGRLDATNIVTPCLSVITSISLDHTETLGKTIEAIAEQKAGIIKFRVPVVIGPRVPHPIVKPIADELSSPFHQVEGSYPDFETENRAIAQVALTLLSEKIPLPFQAIEKGVEQGRQPCRMETLLKNSTTVILDVAHNPDGLRHLFDSISRHYQNKKLRLLLGLSKTKDIEGCLDTLQTFDTFAGFHLVEAQNGRGISRHTLKEKLQMRGVEEDTLFIDETISASVEHALKRAEAADELLVVCGSFFIMSEVRQALGIQEPKDSIDMNERGDKEVIEHR